MKTQLDNTREQQNATATKVLKEPSTGGTATIADNRPSTIYQRKLRETMANGLRSQEHAPLRATMNARPTRNVLPIQRKTSKGSSRFQQIAMAMGDQHGVDTSGLVATHNSSFPATLNAEATIQGNRIHFAPGRDTDYNMRHEVAHAIDNTLHGTPGGDQVVNGQKVDTTREKVVDRMAKEPITQRKGKASIKDAAGLEKGADMMGRRVQDTRFTTQGKTKQDKQYNGSGIYQLVYDEDSDNAKLKQIFRLIKSGPMPGDQVVNDTIYEIFGVEDNSVYEVLPNQEALVQDEIFNPQDWKDGIDAEKEEDSYRDEYKTKLDRIYADVEEKEEPSEADKDFVKSLSFKHGDYFHIKNPRPRMGARATERMILNINSQAKAAALLEHIADLWRRKRTRFKREDLWVKQVISAKFYAMGAQKKAATTKIKYDKVVIYYNAMYRDMIKAGVEAKVPEDDRNENISAFYDKLGKGMGVGEEKKDALGDSLTTRNTNALINWIKEQGWDTVQGMEEQEFIDEARTAILNKKIEEDKSE